MRMRKLGKGQSVVFLVTSEVQDKILECSPKENPDIEVTDVLAWTFHESCEDFRRNMPLWAAQGRRSEGQERLWENARKPDTFKFESSHAEAFLEDESQSLESRYRAPPQT